jgi:NitT/TauT family transport system substrate-binding protein
VLIVAAACARRPAAERLVVGVPTLPQATLVWVAHSQGHFSAQGVTVEMRRFTSGRDALAALRRGDVDLAIAYDTPVVIQAAAGPGLEVLTELHESTRDQIVVARRDRGIARAEDLRGKRVGVPRHTSGEYFVSTLLSFAGVPLDALDVVDVATDQMVDDLVSGQVDAIATWCPHAQRARRALGPNAVELTASVHQTMSMLVTRTEVRVARRPALVRFVAALADAERLVGGRADVAIEVLQRELPDIAEHDLREEWTRFRPRLGMSNLLVTLLAREAEWFTERGVRPGDVRELLRPEILAEVDPEAVTLLDPRRGP